MVLPPVMLAGLFTLCAPSVAPVTLNAVIHTESGGNPWVIASIDDGKSLRFANQKAAIDYAMRLEAAGKRYSAGLMQIFNGNFKNYGVTPTTIFDPCTNIRTGADILTQYYLKQKGEDKQKNVRISLSGYYSGNDKTGFVKEKEFNGTSYVERVEKNAYTVPAIEVTSPAVPSNDTQSESTSEINNTNNTQSWDVFGDFK